MGEHKSNPLAFGTTVPPQLAVRDRFGRPLSPGDEVIVTVKLPETTLFEVIGVVPNLDPRQPPNVGSLQLVTRLNVMVPLTNAAVNEVLVVRSKGEREALVAQQQSGIVALTDRMEDPLDPHHLAPSPPDDGDGA